MWPMACVQGTWWGVGGGVVGGWWGALARVSGFWLGLGSGGGVSGGWRSVPLRPLLNSPSHPLGVRWFLVRAVPLPGGGACRLVGVCGVRFFSDGVGWSCGWLVLRVVFWSGCSQPEGRGCGSRWSLRFGRVFVGACSVVAGSVGCVPCRGVVLELAVSFPLGGPTWTVGLFAAPLFLPPYYTMELPRNPESSG